MNILKNKYKFPRNKPSITYNLQGWLANGNQILLNKYINSNMKIIFEFGTWKGLSATYILKRCNKNCIVICIDMWKGDTSIGFKVKDDLHDQFIRNMWGYKDQVIPLKMDGRMAMKYLHKLKIKPDMIYLDMDHSYKEVKKDLQTLFKYYPNTLILGDDILYWDGVKQAVNEIQTEFTIYNIEINQNCYALIPKWYSIQYNLPKYNNTVLIDLKIDSVYIICELKGIPNNIIKMLLSKLSYPILLLNNTSIMHIKTSKLVENNLYYKNIIFDSDSFFGDKKIDSKLLSKKDLIGITNTKYIKTVLINLQDKTIKDIDYLYKSNILQTKNKILLFNIVDPLNSIGNRLYINNNVSNRILTDKLTIKFWLDYWNYCKNNKLVILINYNKLILQKKYNPTNLIDKKYIIKNSFEYNLWHNYKQNHLIVYIKSNQKLVDIIKQYFVIK